MATFTLLDSFPALVRAFVRRAQAVGIECREGDRKDRQGNALLSLHGTDAQFLQLPGMTRRAFPKCRTAHWWLALGIVGTLYREGDGLAAVIDWTRVPGPLSRCVRNGFKVAKADADFQNFMRNAIAQVEIEPPAAA